MKILVPVKIVLESEDIQIKGDRSLDFSKAKPKLSDYDCNALEIAAQIGDNGVYALSVGGEALKDSKVKKNILSRGVDELFLTCDSAYEDLDAYQTAQALAKLVEEAGEYDLIILGDGSADRMAQQVDVQLAYALNLPIVTAVSHIEVEGSKLKLTRILEDSIQNIEVETPAIISIVPDIAEPRIAGMKDILAAGKKPMHEVTTELEATQSAETVSNLAPEQVQRQQNIKDASDESIAEFAQALKQAANL